ncbi:MAG: ComF family protein [bacterium]|nr:ComF family protein [bacterium]MDZ4286020.1 ComF family protein [Candidatus Sungbacteria bacterium]
METSLKSLFLDLLFPAHCLQCGKEGVFLCDTCKSSLPLLPPVCIGCAMASPAKDNKPPGQTCTRCGAKTPVRVFISPLLYRTPLARRLIHELKYRRITTLAPLLVDIIVSYIRYYRIELPTQAIIMPVPLHPRKERVRGSNQAELIARNLSQQLNRELDTQTIIRSIATPPQSALNAALRHKNVQNIFSTQNSSHLHGKIIILVDDVKTTGSTLEQAARALKKAGAKQIWAITVAR